MYKINDYFNEKPNPFEVYTKNWFNQEIDFNADVVPDLSSYKQIPLQVNIIILALLYVLFKKY